MSGQDDVVPARTIPDDVVRLEALRSACKLGVEGEPACATLTRAIHFLTFLRPELGARAEIDALTAGPVHERMVKLYAIPAQGNG